MPGRVLLTAYLVRHAHAGDRAAWTGEDRLRPLSPRGRRQTDWLAKRLRGARIGRIVSSPSLRCRQTVEPLARSRRRPMVTSARLAEGAGARGAAALLRGGRGVVVCTHGDVMAETLELIRDGGARLVGGIRCAKGACWILDHDGRGRIVRGRYVAPPG